MSVKTTIEKIFGPAKELGTPAERPSVTIRYARAEDALALLELAALDSSEAPSGIVLVAEVDGRIWAAHSVDDGTTVADPFVPSGELAFLLVERARQLRTQASRYERRGPRRREAIAA